MLPPSPRTLGCWASAPVPTTAGGRGGAGASRTHRWPKAGSVLGASPCAVGWTVQVRSWRLHEGPPGGWLEITQAERWPLKGGVWDGLGLVCPEGTSSSCGKQLEAQEQTSQTSSHHVHSWPLCISISSDMTDPSMGYISVTPGVGFPRVARLSCLVLVFC